MDFVLEWSGESDPAQLFYKWSDLIVKFALGLGFGVVIGMGLILALVYWQKLRSRERQDKGLFIATLSRLSLDDIDTLFPRRSFPHWVVIGKYEKANWINRYVKKIWPGFSKATSSMLKEISEPIIDLYRPLTITSLKFQKFTLGTVAPVVQGIRIVDSSSDEIAADIEVLWQGNPSVILKVRSMMGLTFPVQVKDINMLMVFRLIFRPLVEEVPGFAAFTFSIRKKRKFDLTLKVIGGDIGSFPGLSGTVEEMIRATVLDCLMWPMRIPVIILPNPIETDNSKAGVNFTHSDLLPAAVGILDVKLVQAKKLKNKDLVTKADAFALLYIRPVPARMKRSKTIVGELSPVWNEIYEFEVEDSEAQALTIKIFDEDNAQVEELIGCAQVVLKDLIPGIVEEKWVSLVGNLERPIEGKPRGQVNLELLYRPFDRKFPALWSADAAAELPVNNVGTGSASTSATPAMDAGIPENMVDENNLNFIEALRLNRDQPLHPDFSFKGQMWEVVRGVLSITVLRAENLIASDMNGLSDPFVVLKMRKSKIKKQTKVVYKNLNPEWNQTLEFLVEDAIHDMLHIKVWDHDTFKNDFLGKYTTTLTKAVYTGEFEAEFKLDGVPSGTLFLRMKWTPQPFDSLNTSRRRRSSSSN